MKDNKKIIVRQLDITDCGAACLASVSAYYGNPRSVSLIRTDAGTDRNGTSLLGLVKAAEKIGFIASAVRVPDKIVSNKELPAIAHLKVKNVWYHFVVIYSVKGNHLIVMDPAKGKIEEIGLEEFRKDWTNILLLVKPGKNFRKENNYISPQKRLLSIIRFHRSSLLKVIAGAIIYSVLGISTAIYIKKLTDMIIPGGNINHLHIASLVLSLFIITRILTGLLKNYILLKTGKEIDSQLIRDYNRHILNLPSVFFQSMKTGEILSRISDAIKIRNFINMVVQELTVNSLIVIITLSIMFFYSSLMSLIVLSTIPLYVLLYRFLNNTNKKYLRKTMELGAEMESQLVETIKGISTIKAYNTEYRVNKKLKKICEDLLNSIFKASRDFMITSGGAELVSSVCLIIILWTGAYQVIAENMTYGELFSFYSLYAYLSPPLISLILSNRGIQDAKIAADRLFQVMDLQPEGNNLQINRNVNLKEVNLIVKNLSFAYPGKQLLIKSISFECKPGTITALVGESGSGKSTLISLLLKFHLAENGNIFFNESEYKSMSTVRIRALSSFVPQDVKLFTGSLRENISLGENNPNRLKMEKCILKTGLKDLMDKQPEGLDTFISEDGNNFSGGEKQKIALARALYKDANLILLDEPSSSMDLYSERNLLNLLNELKAEGKTILIAAHKLSLIRNADQILVLDGGRIRETGTHSELINMEGNYTELWKYQNQDNFF